MLLQFTVFSLASGTLLKAQLLQFWGSEEENYLLLMLFSKGEACRILKLSRAWTSPYHTIVQWREW